jgi:hypothetical protein
MNFERGQDPKETLGIGLYTYREFPNDLSAALFVINHLPAILGTEGIPKDIIKAPKGPNDFNTAYDKTIAEYLKKYVKSLEGFPGPADWVDASLVWMIIDILAKTKVANHKRPMIRIYG